MPGWLKTLLNIILLIIPEIIKSQFSKAESCEEKPAVATKKKDK
jgi:hypothetical protein